MRSIYKGLDGQDRIKAVSIAGRAILGFSVGADELNGDLGHFWLGLFAIV